MCGDSASRCGGDSLAQDAGVYSTADCIVLCKNCRGAAEAAMAVGVLPWEAPPGLAGRNQGRQWQQLERVVCTHSATEASCRCLQWQGPAANTHPGGAKASNEGQDQGAAIEALAGRLHYCGSVSCHGCTAEEVNVLSQPVGMPAHRWRV